MTATVTSGSGTADAWRPFAGDGWRERIDVRDFIQANYTPYEGDSSFLAGPTGRTRAVWGKVGALFPEERRRGVLDVDGATPSTITSWPTDAGTGGPPARRPRLAPLTDHDVHDLVTGPRCAPCSWVRK